MALDVEDLTFLHALETKHDHQAIFENVSKDHEYLRMRPALLKVLVAVKTKHAVHNSIVYLAASLLDAMVANNIARNASEYNLHVFAVACFILAAKFVDGSAVYFYFNAFKNVMDEVKCQASKIPISHVISSWVDSSDATVEISKFLVLQCQVLVSNQLDWRFNRATADRFLQVQLTQCSLDCSFSENLSAAQEFLDWAVFFCEMTIMSNVCCRFKPSTISMASILAARKFLFDESDGDLVQFSFEQDKTAVLLCTTDILDLFQERNARNVTHQQNCIKHDDKELVSLYCTEKLSASDFTANASFPTTPVQQAAELSAKLSTEPTLTPPPLPRLPSFNFVWDSPPVCTPPVCTAENLHTVIFTPN